MSTTGNPISTQGRSHLPSTSSAEPKLQDKQKKLSLKGKLRQAFSVPDKRRDDNRLRRTSIPDITNLSPKSQEMVLRAVDAFKQQDSKNLMKTLDESRNILKISLEEFKSEQTEYRKKLDEIRDKKEVLLQRRKENAIPISILLQQKRDPTSLSDLHSNPGMNVTYQSYFQALLTTDQNSQQHPADKAAVIKYIRRRERLRRAEQNRKTVDLTGDTLEQQTTELMENMNGLNIKLENEKHRQNDLVRTKLHEKKVNSKNITDANEIIDQAHEADLIRERVERTQREKIEARLSTAIRRRAPASMIHIQSHSNDQNGNSQLTNEEKQATKDSIQLLNEHERLSTAIDENETLPRVAI